MRLSWHTVHTNSPAVTGKPTYTCPLRQQLLTSLVTARRLFKTDWGIAGTPTPRLAGVAGTQRAGYTSADLPLAMRKGDDGANHTSHRNTPPCRRPGRSRQRGDAVTSRTLWLYVQYTRVRPHYAQFIVMAARIIVKSIRKSQGKGF